MQMTIKQKSVYLFLAIFSTVLLVSNNTFAADGPKTTGKKGGEGTASREDTCKDFKDDKKTQCEEAWNKARGTKQGKEKAKSSIDDGKERRESCDGGAKPPPKEPNRAYYCRAAYDKVLIAEAEKKGKVAGEADSGKDDKKASATCREKVKFGRDVYNNGAKKACESAYKTSRNTAEGKGKYTCGGEDGVSTYFDFGCESKDVNAGARSNPIFSILFFIMNLLAGLVSLSVVGGILYGAFLYTSARDNSQQTQKGIQVITDAVIALILYFALYALVNYLVPGGLFS
jgi:hypothetical protein